MADRRAVLGVLAALSLVLSGCVGVTATKVEPTIPGTPTGPSQVGSAPNPGLAKFYSQTIAWQPCSAASSFLCAQITVPLDYAKPAGPTIKVAVLQVQSSGSAKLGSLLLDPGGPGGSGTEFASQIAGAIPVAIRNAYDLIGIDPRGVAKSTPVDCLTDKETDELIEVPPDPDSPAQEKEVVTEMKGLGPACEAKSPEITGHMDTISAAKDMDVLRAALREDTLNYLGYSYGTFLGAVYAEQFPTRVGRFVLDGAVDPALTSAELSKGQAAAFEVAVDHYLDHCIEGGNCPLGTDKAAAKAKLTDFMAQVASNPIAGEPGRPLDSALLTLAVVGSMYAPESQWDTLTQALRSGLAGDGAPLLAITDTITNREPNGTYADNSNVAIYAVNCVDRTDRYNLAQTKKLAEEWGSKWPLIGAAQAWSLLACSDWPAPATFRPHPIVAPGSPDILVIGTEFDPATPVSWAEALAGSLENGKLVIWKGADGHTAYLRSSACVNGIVDRYLLTGVAPAEDVTLCPLSGAKPVSN